jgi:2-dehydro-3-deoxygluconokinase
VPEVTCLGETIAVFVPEPTTGSGGTGYTVHIGGAESNVACALAQQGIPVGWIGRVGEDHFGRLILDTLTRQGVDVTGAETDPNRPTGLYVKELTATGTRMRYYRSGSAATAMTPALAARPAMRDARWLHLSGITPALSDGCAALTEAIVTRPTPGRTVSFDLNWRPALWTGRDPALLLRLARRCDLVFVGQDEAETMWGLTEPDQVRRLIPGPRTLVVKRGAEGAVAYEGGQTVRVGALPVTVVEATGAGDAFAAGFLAGSVRGLPLQARLGLAVRAARAALLTPGDFAPLPAGAGQPVPAGAR